MSNARYKPLPVFRTRDEVEEATAGADPERLAVIALAVGEGFPDPDYAQDFCLGLVDNEDGWVRASACLGLAYVARCHGALDRDRVEPALTAALARAGEHRGRIADAFDDIDVYLGWGLPSPWDAEADTPTGGHSC